MTTLLRSILVVAALFGTVSAASAAPYGSQDNSYAEQVFEEIAKNGA